MKQKKYTKRALCMSLLSMLLCCSMLIGTTFAWFTDSVTSGNNKIVAGNLDIEMYWADGKEDPNGTSTKWTDASTGDPIFNYELWEPGYTVVRHVKISNVGTLALKYEVRIAATGDVSELADVIDVYYIKDGKQVASRSDLTDDNKIGTLTEVLSGTYVAKGHISGKDGDNVNSDVATIALKMQESAGNEYQGLGIGSEFDINLVATQYTEEADSFGNDYDAGAELTSGKTSVKASIEGEELKTALASFVSNHSEVTEIKSGALVDFSELSAVDWESGTPLGDGNVRLINKNGAMYILSKDKGTVPALAGDLRDFFENNTKLEEVDFSGLDLSGVTNFQDAFAGCANLKKANLKGVNLSGASEKPASFGYMFNGCSNLQEVELDGLDLTNVTNIAGMFFGCSSLERVDLSNVKADSLTSTNTMFKNCSSLKEVIFGDGFDTSKVQWMSRMFEGCSQLESLDLRNMRTDSATDMNHMFLGCSSLTALDLTSFNTENVTNMCYMFENCSSLVTLDLSSFDTAKVGVGETQSYNNGFSGMFQECSSLTTIYASDKFVTEQWVADPSGGYSVFSGCNSLKGGADTTFEEYNTGAQYARIDGGTESPGYFTAKS